MGRLIGRLFNNPTAKVKNIRRGGRSGSATIDRNSSATKSVKSKRQQRKNRLSTTLLSQTQRLSIEKWMEAKKPTSVRGVSSTSNHWRRWLRRKCCCCRSSSCCCRHRRQDDKNVNPVKIERWLCCSWFCHPSCSCHRPSIHLSVDPSVRSIARFGDDHLPESTERRKKQLRIGAYGAPNCHYRLVAMVKT